jgi:hypothetical protein
MTTDRANELERVKQDIRHLLDRATTQDAKQLTLLQTYLVNWIRRQHEREQDTVPKDR